MRILLEANEYGLITVDASNAFNSINQITRMLVCCGHELEVSYSIHIKEWAALIVKGSHVFTYSTKGVVEGDPMSMFMYAIGTLPLIHQLKDYK